MSNIGLKYESVARHSTLSEWIEADEFLRKLSSNRSTTMEPKPFTFSPKQYKNFTTLLPKVCRRVDTAYYPSGYSVTIFCSEGPPPHTAEIVHTTSLGYFEGLFTAAIGVISVAAVSKLVYVAVLKIVSL